ncbi:MAG TPA: ATP-binding protein [Myxococcota bacterium]|nr:ATP-binding protein [Myxococcota bacterium]
MNLGAQSGLLAAIVSVAVATSVLLRGRRVLVNRLFILFCANLFVHFLAAFFARFSGLHAWLLVDLAAAALLPVTSLLFFGHFLWKEPTVVRPYLRASYVLSGLAIVSLFTPIGLHQVTLASILVYLFCVLYLCAYLAHVRYLELSSHREQIRLRIFQIVMLAAVTFVMLGMLPGPLKFLRTWGDLVSLFFLYFLSQSLLKYRLLDIQELLGRGLVLMSVALILAVVFGVLVLWAGGSPEVSLFQTFVASFVILILFEPLRDKVEGSTNLLFFRERYEMRRKLDDLRREIANIIDLKQMTTVMLDTLYESMRFSRASVYFEEDGGAGYYLVGSRGPGAPTRIDVATHRAFFEQLKKTPTVVLAERFERLLAEQETLSDSEPSKEVKNAAQVLATLDHMKAGICVPLVGQNEILGLWNLLYESGAESYSTEEIARMMAVGEQMAINIENSKMFERVRERDRLAVLGEMSAGLAHEIRNPLGAIKGAAQYLDPAAVGEDASEFLRIIIEETDRLNLVVNQFLDYARPFQAPIKSTAVNEVVEKTLRLVSTNLSEKGIELRLELQDDLPPLLANAQQLTQVLLNLLNNATEAMPSGGVLSVKTRQRGDGRGSWSNAGGPSASLEIIISDTGHGITAETLGRIFVPFFTTKERGTGLGLAISQRIVEHHGGSIKIRTEEEKGSTFTIVFPCSPDTTRPTQDSALQGETAPGDKEIARAGLPFPDGDSKEGS